MPDIALENGFKVGGYHRGCSTATEAGANCGQTYWNPVLQYGPELRRRVR